MTTPTPMLSVVIPAYNAAETVGATLSSVFEPLRGGAAISVEVIVVDDGSRDAEALAAAVAHWPDVRLLRHAENKGMCAGRNTGLFASRGRVVTILDADDRFVPDWPDVFSALMAEWPSNLDVCWAGCVNLRGETTLSHPNYTGQMTRDDFLAERFTGEYIPMFRGDFIRARGYIDLGTRKSCGLLSYLTFIQSGPFWLSARVLRIYDDGSVGSVTSGWSKAEKARESAICMRRVMDTFGEQYRALDRRAWGGKYLRLAVYTRLAGEPGAWAAFAKGARAGGVAEKVGAFLVLLLGRRFCVAAVGLAKKLGVIKRYG
ncbi:glycosyltransferase family 2 protein [Caenispirillum salinarum]|uniref:glycosyltransferase family 2 protein n=1 Tax=Caenispirillum salinarum TaxID=859058 RepID=UPI003850BB54